MPKLFTDRTREQDILAGEKKKISMKSVGFYLWEMKGIKHDLLSQMAGSTLFTHNLLKKISCLLITGIELLLDLVFSL